jgi:hypothetical protein
MKVGQDFFRLTPLRSGNAHYLTVYLVVYGLVEPREPQIPECSQILEIASVEILAREQ